jgi:hypothetical protein
LNQLLIKYVYEEYSICLYLILFVEHAAKNLKHWSWGAANRVVLNVKVRILQSRCLFLRIEVEAVPPPEVRAVAQGVQAVQVPIAAPVIRILQSIIKVEL